MLGSTNSKNQTAITAVLIKVAAALHKILVEENDSLQKGILKHIEASLEKKVQAINSYNEILDEFMIFAQNNKLDKDDKNLPKINELLQEISRENEKNEALLRINIEVNDSIITSFKDAQVKNIVNKTGYNRQGMVRSSEEVEKVVPSVSLNNKV